MSNIIASELQLTKVLQSTLTAFKRAILPLTSFSTVFRDVELQGDDKIAVPYYPLATSASVSRAATGSYKALASGTETESRIIEPTRNKVQALSFNSTQRSRQPAFDPVKHGEIKGQKLAFDVIADIFSGIRAADFTGATIDPVVAANFDEDEVSELGRLAMEAYWPDALDKSLILNPGNYFNLAKQPALLDASQSGSLEALREAMVRRIMGFSTFGTAGLPTNNGTAFAVLGEADDDTFTAVGHGLAVGDRVRFPAVTGGTGLTADTGRYFVKTVPTDDTFTVSATLGGATLDITADATSGTTCQKFENITGIACYPGALGVAFAPVPPSAAMMTNLADYQLVTDQESGLSLEYKHLVYPDTDEEVQVIEAHYGFGVMEAAGIKIIRES